MLSEFGYHIIEVIREQGGSLSESDISTVLTERNDKLYTERMVSLCISNELTGYMKQLGSGEWMLIDSSQELEYPIKAASPPESSKQYSTNDKEGYRENILELSNKETYDDVNITREKDSPLGLIEILEFKAYVEGFRKNKSFTYLVSINGVYPTSHGKPKFSFPPKEWIDTYKIRTYEVGEVKDWKSFFSKCTDIIYEKKPLTYESSQDKIIEYIAQYFGLGNTSDVQSEIKLESSDEIDNIIDDLIGL